MTPGGIYKHPPTIARWPDTVESDISWMADAACHYEWHTFDAAVDTPKPTRTALALCRTCPVTSQCLTWALGADMEHGVVGGTTAHQRARMRRS